MRRTFISAFVILCGLTLTTVAVGETLGGVGAVAEKAAAKAGSGIAATQRRIAGVITSVEGDGVTITPFNKIGARGGTWGRIDASKTKILIGGRVAHPGELRVTDTVRAELNLDEVWLTIVVAPQ